MEKGFRVKGVRNDEVRGPDGKMVGGVVAHKYPHDDPDYPNKVIIRLDYMSRCVRRDQQDVEV